MEKLYFIITYGCQMNVHESEKLAGIMEELGYNKANKIEDASVIIFNTCCVRENAENTAEGNIGALKKLKQIHPEKIIAVGGCMTQQKGKAADLKRRFPFIDIIFGTHNLENFCELLNNRLISNKKILNVLEREQSIIEGTPKKRDSFPNAWVNIMYGCNNFCTYCIVPYVRGRERSRNINDIVNECESLIKSGYKEITLLGQNVNSYGNDLADGSSFPKLLDEVCKINGEFNVRFMTSHPKDFTKEMVDAIKRNQKVCRSIHLPIQSGSSEILRRMNRHYTKEDYLKKIEYLREKIPDCAITTDIMVGFPGETDADFNDTLDVVKKVKFFGAFTFVYSRRSGTPAASMPDQVDDKIAKERIMKLIEIQNSINKEYSDKYLGKVVSLLCDGFDEKRKLYYGRDNYGKSIFFSSATKAEGFVRVKINSESGSSLVGELVTGDK